jgi:hypothetical protein
MGATRWGHLHRLIQESPMFPIRPPFAIAALTTFALLTACGGGGGADGGATDAERSAAATATADGNPACSADTLGAYYWEVGDADGVKVSGRVGGAEAPYRDTDMLIFSASKWLYAASVVQARGVVDADVPLLNFTSGYSQFGNVPVCVGDTVASCQLQPITQDPATIGRFSYDSGHMQQHAATRMGLGDADNAGLAAHLRATIGDFGFVYELPQPATGVRASAAGYAGFLRKVLTGELRIAAALGTHAACTNPDTPDCNADRTVDSSADEDMDYSLGHWVEADPQVGDGAYSSAGAGGFYPWIDRDQRTYGILARQHPSEGGAGFNSLACGRLIRQAWMTGTAVSATRPTPY